MVCACSPSCPFVLFVDHPLQFIREDSRDSCPFVFPPWTDVSGAGLTQVLTDSWCLICLGTSDMDLQLRGKRALVTGSTAGIGLAIAKRLAAEGADVIVNGRTDARVAEAVAAVRAGAQQRVAVAGVVADLATAAGCDKAIAEAGRVDVLVNNLGIFEVKPFAEIPDADWLRFFETNVLSGVRLCRHYLPAMLAADWGRVLFVSSESGVQIPEEMVHYGMTKSAQISVARGLAELTKGSKVTVNSVLPGPTKSEGVTEFVASMAKQQKTDSAEVERQFFKTARPTSLLQRFEDADEIAAVVAFLCSPLSSAINGAAVRADGGVIKAMV
jgi:NAD(P)-dependent dehydrogenase (short-subunit alcohol dehydrogenase family)